MKRYAVAFVIIQAITLSLSGGVFAQGQDWMTNNADAQRSAWIRSDAKISVETLQKPGFQFLWKLKVDNKPSQLNSLMPPSTLERLIGYRGFRMLGFFGGSSDRIFTIDTDLGRMEWEKQLKTAIPSQPGSIACPGGMTNGVVRPTLSSIIDPPRGRGGSGRRAPAKSAVGEAGEGAVTLTLVRPARPNPSPPRQPSTSARVNPANPPGGQFGRGPFLVYALSSDGMFHSMHLSNGVDYGPPIKFLPPGANSTGLIVIDNVAYVTTTGNCGGVENGIWALDLATRKVTTWKSNVTGAAGPVFDEDGTIFVATASGGNRSNSVVALESKSLSVKGWYSAGDHEFSSSPVIFEHDGKTLIAATTKDGRVHLLDSGNPGGADHKTALFTTTALLKNGDFAPSALTSWQDPNGTRWILASTTGGQAAELGFPETNGKISSGAVVAWKIVERNGALTLQPGWASRDLVSPLTPTIIHGVAFVVSSGEFRPDDDGVTLAERIRRSTPAVIYALDATTGKELWNSGSTITSFVHGGTVSGNMGQIYLGTHDGTIYTFGFPMEH